MNQEKIFGKLSFWQRLQVDVSWIKTCGTVVFKEEKNEFGRDTYVVENKPFSYLLLTYCTIDVSCVNHEKI